MVGRLSTDNVTEASNAISGLLRAWGDGDLQARDSLLPLVYLELRRRAAISCGGNGPTTRSNRPRWSTRRIKLAGQDRVHWKNRPHFFGVAAQMMRRILVDHAREHHRPSGPARRSGSRSTIGSRPRRHGWSCNSRKR